MLFRSVERPMLSLLTAMQGLRQPTHRFLQHSHLLELPSSERTVRSLMLGVQSIREGRNLFGWSWKRYVQSISQLPFRFPVSSAEALSLSYLPMQSVYSFVLSRVDRSLPFYEAMYDVDSEDTPSPPSQQVVPSREDHVPIRLVTRAYDAPITRMDNIRRSRVMTRVLDSGR